ncbi:hypothetical protein [Desulfovibrio ferrophilus]|uniref:Uncharacterized protein n=1 Tax=Desulfovibrio ferrophilus TaxID=241368 RepID=A0A2Z6B1L5_9BACT|nr:hypothetical protein [Desulfovibrio ferrophilus]BBD09382.1 uncharacterized protein DFE_2656 [Desulfovibrio ferrophilus]
MLSEKPYLTLFDDNGDCAGVWISPELWEQAKDQLQPILSELCDEPAAAPDVFPEPMEDWQCFIDYWDLPYPLTMDVDCDHCGAHTDDWQKDAPRLFRLKAASLGGLTTFECQTCQARIMKKHFKDGLKSETVPYTE